ncbi:MAG: hypothetical protein U5N55_06185 [Cypionkella sp.]|nr:hypothetical protein [Cypionkella sp.]
MKQVKVRPLDLGKYPSRLRTKPIAHLAEWVAGALALIWVVAVVRYVMAQPAGAAATPSALLTLVVVFVPLTLIFAVLITLRSVRALRAEAARLQASVDAMRKAFLAGQGQGEGLAQPAMARKLDEIAEQTLQTQTALANMAAKVTGGGAGQRSASARGHGGAIVQPQADPRPEEPPLALGQPAQDVGAPLSVEDFIRAMNFPDGPEDSAGFAAMRAALANRDIAKLIRAAQDVLKLLAQDGIYMDDLKHDPAAADPWRRFARGQRGQAVSALGGVRDRSALALSVGRLRNDPVFRDAAHHFLRAFDRCLTEFEQGADDADLAALAKTRTARAFMLLGRVLGTFD